MKKVEMPDVKKTKKQGEVRRRAGDKSEKEETRASRQVCHSDSSHLPKPVSTSLTDSRISISTATQQRIRVGPVLHQKGISFSMG